MLPEPTLFDSPRPSKPGPKPKPDPENYCRHCEKRMFRQRFNGRLEDLTRFTTRIYCSSECSSAAKVTSTPTLSTLRQRARKQVTKAPACGSCGATEDLDVHHIDSDPGNNTAANTMTLCRRCHVRWHHEHGFKNGTLFRVRAKCRVCGKPAKGHGLCPKHRVRMRLYGDPGLTKRVQDGRWVLVKDES